MHLNIEGVLVARHRDSTLKTPLPDVAPRSDRIADHFDREMCFSRDPVTSKMHVVHQGQW